MTVTKTISIDPDVVKALLLHDKDAQRIVYEALSPVIYTMALRILNQVQSAEDVTQDTFVDVFQKVDKLREPSSIVGWIRKIAMNHCLMHVRSAWYRKVDFMTNSQMEALHQSDDDPSESIDVDRAFRKLPINTRLVVWMYCVEGYTHEEIGKLLDQSPSYSKSLVSRARTSWQKNRTSNEPSQDQLAARVKLNGAP